MSPSGVCPEPELSKKFIYPSVLILPLTSKAIFIPLLLLLYPLGFSLEFPPIVVTLSFDKIIFPVDVISFILKSVVEDIICNPVI